MTKQELSQALYLFRDLWCQNIDLSAIDEFVESVLVDQPDKPTEWIYDIDCASEILMQVSIKDNIPTVLQAIDGYGRKVPIELFKIFPQPLPTPPQQKP